MSEPKKSASGKSEKKPAAPERGGGEAREKVVSSVIPPPRDEVLEFIKTQPYVTPYVLADKFGVRISVAKQVLRTLADGKYLRLVAGDGRMRIYEPVKEALVAVEAEAKAKKKKAK
ncbi:MAG: hypothetical protein N3F65_04245 [Nitrososphaeria archaeon]|nr:hypothetical protein [Aigarchaeota archaeon]MCX8187802.1 hypothetical protein [Nitrososphaeria archaeon]